MKNLTLATLSAALFFLITACHESPKTTTSTISFAMEGYGSDTIRLWQSEPAGFSAINPRELVVDASGSGAIEIAYPDNSFVYVRIGDFVFSIINIPGSDLVIKGEAADLPNTLTVSGEGSLPINYTRTKERIIREYNELDGRDFIQLDSTEFWTRMEAFNEEIDSLNTWLASQRLDPELESLLVLESQQQANAFILLYALVKRNTDPKYSLEIPYDRTLFMSFSSSYSQVLALNYELHIVGPAWVKSGASNNDSISNIFPKILSETIDTLGIPEYAKDYYTARMLLSYFGVNLTSPAVEEVYADWLSKYPHSIFRNALSNTIESISSLAPGVQAPIITGIDSNGNDFSIEDLKGQVIYIDVWATWCSGCVEKIPKMYALQEEFKGQEQIDFLFVSMDKDLDRWKSYISKLPGAALHINANSTEIYKHYMLGGIPHYIIIDANGNIYRSNAPDPDSNEIRAMLEAAMKQAS